ncbi:MAG: hypothetical protein ACEQSR_11595 [Candidatus Methylacidiphilales bacterium]
MKSLIKLTILFLFIAIIGCRQDEAITKAGLNTIYIKYKNGSIAECECKGQKVYLAGMNYYHAASGIYDTIGKVIGNCNWAWGDVDTICYQLKNCETIYRCNNHLSGLPFVDKYGLSK